MSTKSSSWRMLDYKMRIGEVERFKNDQKWEKGLSAVSHSTFWLFAKFGGGQIDENPQTHWFRCRGSNGVLWSAALRVLNY